MYLVIATCARGGGPHTTRGIALGSQPDDTNPCTSTRINAAICPVYNKCLLSPCEASCLPIPLNLSMPDFKLYCQHKLIKTGSCLTPEFYCQHNLIDTQAGSYPVGGENKTPAKTVWETHVLCDTNKKVTHFWGKPSLFSKRDPSPVVLLTPFAARYVTGENITTLSVVYLKNRVILLCTSSLLGHRSDL